MAGWLKGVLVGFLFEVFKFLWAYFSRKWRAYQATREYKKAKKQNAEIRKKVENAETPEQMQDALNRAADRFGRRGKL